MFLTLNEELVRFVDFNIYLIGYELTAATSSTFFLFRGTRCQQSGHQHHPRRYIIEWANDCCVGMCLLNMCFNSETGADLAPGDYGLALFELLYH